MVADAVVPRRAVMATVSDGVVEVLRRGPPCEIPGDVVQVVAVKVATVWEIGWARTIECTTNQVVHFPMKLPARPVEGDVEVPTAHMYRRREQATANCPESCARTPTTVHAAHASVVAYLVQPLEPDDWQPRLDHAAIAPSVRAACISATSSAIMSSCSRSLRATLCAICCSSSERIT